LAQELPIIQKAHDLIKWYAPILNRMPRDQKFMLGDRILSGLYGTLEELIRARYERDKLARLERINAELEVLRHQTRLLREFDLISPERYAHAAKLINDIGTDLGGWMRQQRKTG
jgi:hypothetical protein